MNENVRDFMWCMWSWFIVFLYWFIVLLLGWLCLLCIWLGVEMIMCSGVIVVRWFLYGFGLLLWSLKNVYELWCDVFSTCDFIWFFCGLLWYLVICFYVVLLEFLVMRICVGMPMWVFVIGDFDKIVWKWIIEYYGKL